MLRPQKLQVNAAPTMPQHTDKAPMERPKEHYVSPKKQQIIIFKFRFL